MDPGAFNPAASTAFPLALLRQEEGSPSPGAQETGQVTTTPGVLDAPPPDRPPPPWWMNPLIPLILMVLVFYFFIIGGSRKRDRQRKELVSSLARGDRVVTIGGIIGNVVDVAGDEVVLKVDETNNTKIRITRAAVGNVVKPGTEKKG